MNRKEQIFKTVFGPTWDQLPLVFKKRYSNRPYERQLTTVEGEMDIYFSKAMRCFMPFFRIFHVLIPYAGKSIPVKVDFRSEKYSNAVFLDRKFYVPDKKVYEFNSCMEVIKENDVVERMSFGIGWQTNFFYDGIKIVMQHKRYVWKILGLTIPLPLEILIGKGYAEEEVINDNAYRVTMTMKHPLFGTMYSYSGIFTFKRLST